jgi:hypothetical protein
MPYEVQHYTLLDGWINTWSYAEADGVMQPETFATADEAKAALDEFFQDLEEEVLTGQSGPYSREEFRVEHVLHAHTPATTKQENQND